MTSGSSSFVGHGSARVRFASVPNNASVPTTIAPTTTTTFNNGIENEMENRKKDVCRYFDEGEKRLRIKSKEVVLTYAPLQWQPLLLDVVELLFRHTHKIISNLHRHFGQSWSSNDSSTMNHVSTTINTHGKTFRTIFFACLLILLCFFAYTFVLKIIIQLALPFYASFNAAYWFFQWRRKYDTSPPSSSSSSSSSTIGVHQQILVATDDVVKLIYFCCLADLAIIIFALFAIDSTSSYAQISLLHVLPLISYSTAKYIISPYLETSTDDIILSFNNYYFIAFFAIRLFAYKGFVLVPWLIRPYLAYLSIYLALIAADRTARNKLDVNNVNASAAQASDSVGAGVRASSGTFCSHCINNQLSNANKTPLTQSPANLRPLKLVTPSSDTDLYQKHSSIVRPSRRVSLPAGSLMPIKTQVQ